VETANLATSSSCVAATVALIKADRDAKDQKAGECDTQFAKQRTTDPNTGNYHGWCASILLNSTFENKGTSEKEISYMNGGARVCY
jgi:hypothetical protein